MDFVNKLKKKITSLRETGSVSIPKNEMDVY